VGFLPRKIVACIHPFSCPWHLAFQVLNFHFVSFHFESSPTKSHHAIALLISCAPNVVALGWRLWGDVVAGLTTAVNNYIRLNGLSILNSILNFHAQGHSFLLASSAPTLAMFVHLLEEHATIPSDTVKMVLRILGAWVRIMRCVS
jgi:hypothetical protein